MSNAHQLIIDCGMNGDYVCQLNDAGLSAIKLHTQQSFTQYKYYLLFNNHLKQNCQLNLNAETIGEYDSIFWSKIYLKIHYQDQKIFAGNLHDFFSNEINFSVLAKESSKLYILDFYFADLIEEFSIDYLLNFYLNCQNQLAVDEFSSEQVLGLKNEPLSIQPKQTAVTAEIISHKSNILLLACLGLFLVFLFIILRFYKAKFKKASNIN